ncbi:MAG TPA: sodium ion-translocating decarboxylase subunit beta [Dehalococcoidia bacterium]|nr:sodium ion-translocating decarboxylase subunit beta [Dehalococcoidia bacterium]
MFVLAFFFMYLAIKKNMESYELLPIGLGIIIANLPLAGMAVFDSGSGIHQSSGIFGVIFYYTLSFWNILPPIIFLGLGAITDFTPLINNPKTLLLGAAAQIGIFVSFWGASLTGYFTLKEAASIGIIGGADGPTTIFLTASLAPHLLGITAVIAYSYMAAVAFIQPPIMKLLTTKSERNIIMQELGPVNNKLKILFPNIAMFLIILIVPRSAPLISMFMIGNILKESGVVPRLVDAASNELINLSTIFLMLTIGTQLNGPKVINVETLLILGLGLVAFAVGSASGIILAKIMNLFLKQKINPLIGSAGVSAVPMAARISHHIGQEENSNNYLLSHAMGPNVAGVIGSAVIAGLFIALIN